MIISATRISIFIMLFHVIKSESDTNTCKPSHTKKKFKLDCKNVEDLKIAKLSPEVYELVLSQNQLSGVELSFEKFHKLEKLYMVDCDLDLNDISENLFKPLSALKSLDLSRNKFHSIPRIFSPKLKRLILSDGSLSSFKFPDTFSENVKLQSIVLSSNKVDTIKGGDFLSLKSLPVISLRISACGLSSISSDSFNILEKLNYLFLNSNKLTTDKLREALSSKNALKEMLTLSIKKNLITELKMNTFPKNKLHDLFLDGNPLHTIDDDAFVLFSSLKLLSLKSCSLMKLGQSLASLKQLNQLFLNKNPLESIPDDIPENVEIVDLSYTGIISVKASSFRNCAFLKKLIIKNAKLKNIEENAFMHTSDLELLDLSENQLSGVFVNENAFPFLGLSKLITLNLDNNYITKLQKSSFVGLKNLKSLSLQNNKISWWHADAFKFAADSLENLNMQNNEIAHISDDPLNSFFLMKQLTTFDLSLNIFDCDCSIIRFKDWLLKNKLKESESMLYECASPASLKGSNLLSFNSNGCSKQLRYLSASHEEENKHVQPVDFTNHVIIIIIVIVITSVVIAAVYVFRHRIGKVLQKMKLHFQSKLRSLHAYSPSKLPKNQPNRSTSTINEIETISSLIELDVLEPPCGTLVLLDQAQSSPVIHPNLSLSETLVEFSFSSSVDMTEAKQLATEKWLSTSVSGEDSGMLSASSDARRCSDATSDVSLLCLDEPPLDVAPFFDESSVDALFICSAVNAKGDILKTLFTLLGENEITVSVKSEWSDRVMHISARAVFVVLSEALIMDTKALELMKKWKLHNPISRLTPILLQPQRRDLYATVWEFEPFDTEVIFEDSIPKLKEDVFNLIFR